MNRYIKIGLILLGFILFQSGDRMNQWVIARNDGKMPVIDYNGKSTNFFTLYQNATNETNYILLADNQNYWGFSLGDGVMFLGGIVFFIGLMLKEDSLDKLNATESK